MKDEQYKDCEIEDYKFENNLTIPKKKFKIQKYIYKYNLKEIKKFDYVNINYSIGKNIRSEMLFLENNFYQSNYAIPYKNKSILLSGPQRD